MPVSISMNVRTVIQFSNRTKVTVVFSAHLEALNALLNKLITIAVKFIKIKKGVNNRQWIYMSCHLQK